MSTVDTSLTPEMLLAAYTHGCFPMAEDYGSKEIHWYAPNPRGVIPLDQFYVPKTLAKLIRKSPFEICTDRDFEGVMRACAERDSTWISEDLITVYTELHKLGYAHTIECWLDDTLVGGLYGVAIGGAYFGESMFHRVRDASKVALVYLVHVLREKGYALLDTQFVTDHLKKFGALEIDRDHYEAELEKAIALSVEAWHINQFHTLEL